MNCAFCQKEITEKKIHMRDECPVCGRDLHICLNCEFYDSNAYRQCRESIKEPVLDKERANFCDFFRASQGGAAQAGPASETIKTLNNLFK
jgi:rRNA maturation protein Nop10